MGISLRAAKELSDYYNSKKSWTTYVLGHRSILFLCEGGGRELVTFSFSDTCRQKGSCQEESANGPGRGQMNFLVII